MIALLSLPEIKLGLEETRALMERSVRDASPRIRDGLAALIARDRAMYRAALVILASGFGRADAGRMLGIAAAVELLDLAIGLHREAIDGGADPRQAVLMGDYLLTRSLGLFLESIPKADPALFSRTMERIFAGEIEEGFQRFDPSATVRTCLRHAHEKSAVLFGLAMRLAAVEASCPRRTAQALTRFGYCLGMGYQLSQDVLDVARSGSGLAAGNFTLPVVLAMKEKGSKLPGLLKKPPYSAGKLRKILKAARGSAAMVKARELADGYGRLALKQLEALPDTNARAALRELAGAVMNRKA